jgi:hypothetical protein
MFDNLENTLKLILEKLEYNEELLQLSISTLTTKKELARFLNKSDRTIDNYVKNKTLKKDIHYFYNERNRVEFIPFAILKFKKAPQVISTPIIDITKKMYHSSVNSITQGLKVG